MGQTEGASKGWREFQRRLLALCASSSKSNVRLIHSPLLAHVQPKNKSHRVVGMCSIFKEQCSGVSDEQEHLWVVFRRWQRCRNEEFAVPRRLIPHSFVLSLIVPV